ncbi:MAG TPA: hypothetical protein IGS53_09705 [Leptolyngbyaceae cyanobacterium M33_DOE_097]|uniref:Uncharacterized protein n=1 Tax=Oscillatoriales cyanobacterium SpSt-418 TaxID=2282169 RepID=A0A7C3KD50_9CYAN|nr:hypothetical protein [Leptolyngbyaceae cyanobacterium M33_DOE_097]
MKGYTNECIYVNQAENYSPFIEWVSLPVAAFAIAENSFNLSVSKRNSVFSYKPEISLNQQ